MVLLVSRHKPYIFQKTLGWIYITLFLLLLAILPDFGKMILLGIFSFFALREFLPLTATFSLGARLGIGVVFLLLLSGYVLALYEYLMVFVIVFILFSLSDIVAYTIGSLFPWRK